MATDLEWDFHGTHDFDPENQICSANPRDEKYIPYGIDYRRTDDGFCLSVTLNLRGITTMVDAQAIAQKIENAVTS